MQKDKRKEMLDKLESICKDQIVFAKSGMEMMEKNKVEYCNLMNNFNISKSFAIVERDYYEKSKSEYLVCALGIIRPKIDSLQKQLSDFSEEVENLLRSI